MAPKIIMPDIVTVRAGSKMAVEAIVAGKPAPFCKWKQGNEDVLTSERLSVVKTLTSCTLIIKHVTRKDSGYYSLSAENSTGKVNQILRVTVMGEASPVLPVLRLHLFPGSAVKPVCCGPHLSRVAVVPEQDLRFEASLTSACATRHPWTTRSSSGGDGTGHRCLHSPVELPTGRRWQQHH